MHEGEWAEEKEDSNVLRRGKAVSERADRAQDTNSSREFWEAFQEQCNGAKAKSCGLTIKSTHRLMH